MKNVPKRKHEHQYDDYMCKPNLNSREMANLNSVYRYNLGDQQGSAQQGNNFCLVAFHPKSQCDYEAAKAI